ncbi:SDR family oxidoreductase [Halobacteria archaeon AArc-curdl1]|uniref:SDR family oxidoreductase n=1 Tax=Natronosalvus hydrolyticus TaxID=2979988 RepID=A0AAP3E6K1_9EURY|nr:SDR family oxidoreductase [Halobacteria archaeon AArc-curdl1]
MEPLLANKTAVITGGASGIGREIAHTYATQGASVVVADLQPEPREGGEPIHEIIDDETDSTATFVECDVTERGDLEAAVEAATDLDGLDIMVNNAGIVGPVGPIQDVDPADFQQLLAVNVEGVFTGCQVATETMLEREAGGSIINMSSVAGLVGYPNITPYSLAKGGIRMLTYGLAGEVGPHGIRVNSIHPGVIETEMTTTDFPIIGGEDEDAALEAIPLRRFGQPEDVANVATFLASDWAAHVTAESIVVDGGEFRTA